MIAIGNYIGKFGGETASMIRTAYESRVEEDGGVVESLDCLQERVSNLKSLGLWDKASAVWLPHGYKEGKLYAAKGGAEADLTIVRAGTRIRKGPTYVEQVPYNLFGQSNYFGTSPWISERVDDNVTVNDAVDPEGNLTADTFTINSATNQTHRVYQNITMKGNSTYTISVHFKAGTYSEVCIGGTNSPVFADSIAPIVRVNLVTGTLISAIGTNVNPEIFDAGNGWYKVVFRVKAATTDTGGWMAITPHSNVASSFSGLGRSIHIWRAQMVAGTEELPYFDTTNRFNVPALDYTNDTCPALSLEPARTNLLVQSETFDNASWTKASMTVTANSTAGPENLSTADTFNENAGATSAAINQSVAKAASAIQYTFSVSVKPAGRSWVILSLFDGASLGSRYWFNVSTGVVGSTLAIGAGFTGVSARIIPEANGFYRCIITATSSTATAVAGYINSASGDGALTFTASSTGAALYLWGAQLEAGSYATSYIPTTTATVSRIADSVSALYPKGTNLVLQSQTLDNVSWTKTNGTVTANDTLAPDGTLTADKIVASASSCFIRQIPTVLPNYTYTFSFHIKKGSDSWCNVTIHDGGTNGGRRWINLDTGALGSPATLGTGFTFGTPVVTSEANGFWRISWSFRTLTNTSLSCIVHPVVNADGSLVNDTGDYSHMWGMQLEPGDTATTYKATTTVPVHDGSVIGQTEGTWYLEFDTFADGTDKVFSIDSGTADNRIEVTITNTNQIRPAMVAGGALQADAVALATIVTGTRYRLVVTYRLGRFAVIINGVLVLEDLTVAAIPSLCTMRHTHWSGIRPVFGKVYANALCTTALTDAQAIALTTP